MSTLLDPDELVALGFASLGRDVRIDRRAALFNTAQMRLGSHVRIDAFAVLAGGSAELSIGSFVHIGAGCYLSAGDGGIDLGDFCTIAPRCAFHGHSDDYVDGALTGGIVPAALTGGVGAPIVLEPHVIVGSSSVVLQGVTLGRGAAVGALTRIHRSVPAGAIAAGNPFRLVGTRDCSRLDAQAAQAWELMP